MKLSYYDENNILNINKLDAKIEEMPSFIRQFFIGIEQTTNPLTRLNYANDLKIFFYFLTEKVRFFKNKDILDIQLNDLEQIEATDIEYYLSFLSAYTCQGKLYKNGEKGKSRKLSAIRCLLKYFYNKNYISKNVASKVASPKIHEKEIVRLEGSEVELILDTIEQDKKFDTKMQNSYNINTRDRDIAIYTLLLGTGIRVSELVGINIDDVDLNTKRFVVTRKGGNRTYLYFTDEVSDALSNYLHARKKIECSEENALFLSLQKKRITIRAVQNIIKKYAKIITTLKNITPHKLRSTFGTELYRNTKDIYVVAEVLGHKDVNTTKKHYASISEDIKKDATKSINLRKK